MIFIKSGGAPDASDAELLRCARTLTIVLGVLAIGLAYLVPNVLDLILYAYTFGAAGFIFSDVGIVVLATDDRHRRLCEYGLWGGSAVIWMAIGEPYGFTAAYLGWGVGLPVLVLVSLATQHSASENLNLFARPAP